MCIAMSSIKRDPTKPGPMRNLSAIELSNKNRMSDCRKMKVSKKSFYGSISVIVGKSNTDNSIFAKIQNFGLCLLKMWAFKFGQKGLNMENMDQ